MGTVFAVGSALYGQYANNKALQAQGAANRQTARNYITSMNYSLQNLEQTRRDAFEATIDDLEQNKLQGSRQEAMVNASVNEGLQGGGRTANLLKRSAQADTNRAISSIKENYKKKSNEIDLNKEATVLNARNSISSIKDVKKPSLLSTLVSLGTAYMGARTTWESINGMRHQAGVIGHGVGDNTVRAGVAIPTAPKYTPTGDWSIGAGVTSQRLWRGWDSAYAQYYNVGNYSFAPSDFNYINPFNKYTQTKQQVNYF